MGSVQEIEDNHHENEEEDDLAETDTDVARDSFRDSLSNFCSAKFATKSKKRGRPRQTCKQSNRCNRKAIDFS